MYSLVSAVFCDIHATRQTIKLLTNGSVGFFFFISYPGHSDKCCTWKMYRMKQCCQRSLLIKIDCCPLAEKKRSNFSCRAWKSTRQGMFVILFGIMCLVALAGLLLFQPRIVVLQRKVKTSHNIPYNITPGNADIWWSSKRCGDVNLQWTPKSEGKMTFGVKVKWHDCFQTVQLPCTTMISTQFSPHYNNAHWLSSIF